MQTVGKKTSDAKNRTSFNFNHILRRQLFVNVPLGLNVLHDANHQTDGKGVNDEN